MLSALKSGGELRLPALAAIPDAELEKLETGARNYAAELEKAVSPEMRAKLQVQLAELSDRALLTDLLPEVRAEIARLQNMHFLGVCSSDTSTNAITKLGNTLADDVITPHLRDRFQQEIVKLAADKVRVEIVRSGGKFGSPQYQVRLFAKPGARVRNILSEGEQTCVALAAFLTELATAQHSSALIFDDPVSSLDHKWRRQVAKRLVEEAGQRQIIVFTHDLVFANDLQDLADKKVPCAQVSLSRGPNGAGVVADGFPWTGKSVKDRVDKMEKEARAAKVLYDAHDDDKYAEAVSRIYSKLRASWERAIEDVAFSQVVSRHRDYINTKNLKRATVLTEPDCDDFLAGFQKCCDVIDAHDPSSGRNAVPPPPDEVLRDIASLGDWASCLQERQKLIA